MTTEARRIYIREWMQRWRAENPDKYAIAKERRRERDRLRRAADPEAWAAENREWFLKNPEKRYEYNLLRKYGITLDAYNELLAKQGGVCAICHRPPRPIRRERVIHRLQVDHCHKTGKIRGLLCLPCNSILGNAGDDREILRAALAYLAVCE